METLIGIGAMIAGAGCGLGAVLWGLSKVLSVVMSDPRGE